MVRKAKHHKHNGSLTYSQRKREKMDYRQEYFRNNPGLFGKLYFCAYCKRPLFRKDVQVDHIMPLNNALGRNVRYNLVAACATCNRNKSDKVDGRVVIGYASKVTDTALYAVQNVFVYSIYLITRVITKTISVIGSIVIQLLFRSGIMSILLWVLIILIIAFKSC